MFCSVDPAARAHPELMTEPKCGHIPRDAALAVDDGGDAHRWDIDPPGQLRGRNQSIGGEFVSEYPSPGWTGDGEITSPPIDESRLFLMFDGPWRPARRLESDRPSQVDPHAEPFLLIAGWTVPAA